MLVCLVSSSDPVSGTGTGFDSSPIKGEGDSVGWFVLLYALPRLPCGFPPTRNELAPRSYPVGTQRGVSPPLWIADQVRNDGCHALLHPVVSRLRGNDGEGSHKLRTRHLTCGYWIKSAVAAPAVTLERLEVLERYLLCW